jgi:hypothetical protein
MAAEAGAGYSRNDLLMETRWTATLGVAIATWAGTGSTTASEASAARRPRAAMEGWPLASVSEPGNGEPGVSWPTLRAIEPPAPARGHDEGRGRPLLRRVQVRGVLATHRLLGAEAGCRGAHVRSTVLAVQLVAPRAAGGLGVVLARILGQAVRTTDRHRARPAGATLRLFLDRKANHELRQDV